MLFDGGDNNPGCALYSKAKTDLAWVPHRIVDRCPNVWVLRWITYPSNMVTNGIAVTLNGHHLRVASGVNLAMRAQPIQTF